MNYPDSVRFLYSLGNEVKTAKYGLDRITTVLEVMGHPEKLPRIVHVAGTNGKGSTCAMIESGLRAAGLRTGLFTSPHLLQPTERVRIDGRPVTAEQFSAAFDRVHACAEELLNHGAIDFHPTYFETVTAMAFVLFQELKTEAVVLEVGLGGRLDATNVVDPELCVITPIDFDHEALLGKSLEAIAGEKAGILKRGVPAVFAAQRPEAQQTLDQRAGELGVEVIRAQEIWRVEDVVYSARGSSFTAAPEFPPVRRSLIRSARSGARPLHILCPLAGEHQVTNAVVALAALARLGVPDAAIERGIAVARWPGRLDRISETPEIILDGAHNPAGARALAAYIQRFYSNRHVVLIYGAMRDKAVAEMTGILFAQASEVIATAPRQSRAVDPDTIRNLADHPRVRTASDLASALDLAAAFPLARQGPPDRVIFITGSLFLVGEALALLNG
ncbi:MAG TPA: folylpolyglutamate synthase/dihydrofolate synthase family protein [Bryobacteraceae bacterium]|nr:folylpolyglutamate synthase/dihydrofolate synthase family protein [Bryobacteraceae bacterium]